MSGVAAIIPLQSPQKRLEAKLNFVLEFEADDNEDFLSVGRRVVLRPLQ